ncbi:hypothetical protein N7474_010124 [Penicillium riverlandense]|uniref:uncharacterized protein n=1 Tax=Penicillium riverlandense TaxID=1903569 RepID=UPI002549A0F3|nr:uncharacterized protein N7474_010124 [Penicillium riverlandense]KAJ5808855.1 hypothetical protein N7474_010124 [Penicillium riverlandense]
MVKEAHIPPQSGGPASRWLTFLGELCTLYGGWENVKTLLKSHEPCVETNRRYKEMIVHLIKQLEDIRGLAQRGQILDAKVKGLNAYSQEGFGGVETVHGVDHGQVNDRFHAGDMAPQTRQPRPSATQRSTLHQGLPVTTQRQSPPQPISDLGVSWPMNQHPYPSSGNPPSNHVQPPSHLAPGLPQGPVGTMQQQNGFTVDPGQFGASTANGNGLSVHPSQIPTTQQGMANWEFATQNPVSAASTNGHTQHPDIYDLDRFFTSLGENI